MRDESKKYLYDIAHAATSATKFIGSASFEEYASDPILRSAVERQLEIAGEALAQLARMIRQPQGRFLNIDESLRFATFSSMAMPQSITASCGTFFN